MSDKGWKIGQGALALLLGIACFIYGAFGIGILATVVSVGWFALAYRSQRKRLDEHERQKNQRQRNE